MPPWKQQKPDLIDDIGCRDIEIRFQGRGVEYSQDILLDVLLACGRNIVHHGQADLGGGIVNAEQVTKLLGILLLVGGQLLGGGRVD
jgi:hypothetical protein